MISDVALDLGELLPSVAALLVLSVMIETDDEPYEQMLFTLGELCVFGPIPLSVFEPFRRIEPVPAWETDYIADIFENASGQNPDERDR